MSPFWILLQLRMMEVVVTTGAISHAKLRQIIPPTNQHPVFLQAGCPSWHPTNRIRALTTSLHNSDICNKLYLFMQLRVTVDSRLFSISNIRFLCRMLYMCRWTWRQERRWNCCWSRCSRNRTCCLWCPRILLQKVSTAYFYSVLIFLFLSLSLFLPFIP